MAPAIDISTKEKIVLGAVFRGVVNPDKLKDFDESDFTDAKSKAILNLLKLGATKPEYREGVKGYFEQHLELLVYETHEVSEFISDLKTNRDQTNTARFKELSPQDLIEFLGTTIKYDDDNKLVTFLCQLSTYTENSQFNISFNAPSSTGKSYIPLEIKSLFPKEDVITLGYCSPTAFFHDLGEWDKERKVSIINLARKILIFLDQPHFDLLGRLRPLLSHDQKEISLKITDRTQKQGLKTKNVILIGFPSVIFCTAGLKIDEQEATRFLLLSPEISQEKLRSSIYEKLKKESDLEAYEKSLNSDPDRELLKARIKEIKREQITEIKIPDIKIVEKLFFEKNSYLKPRFQRDIGRVIKLIKTFALLNLWHRDRENSTVIANEQDIRNAFTIWDSISESQELSLPPYIYEFYKNVLIPLWKSKGEVALSRKDITKAHFQTYRRPLTGWQLRQEIIPMLEASGLITQEVNPADKREMLIHPTASLTISDKSKNIVS